MTIEDKLIQEFLERGYLHKVKEDWRYIYYQEIDNDRSYLRKAKPLWRAIENIKKLFNKKDSR